MKLINQPEGTSICGQCVVAMLTGQPLEAVVANMGEGRSYPADMRKALRQFGVSVPSRSTPWSSCAPKEGRGAALVWGVGRKRSHWVAFDAGFWFDPASPELLTDVSRYEPSAVAVYAIQPAPPAPGERAGREGRWSVSDRDDESSEFVMAYCERCQCTHAFGFDGFSGAPLELPWCRQAPAPSESEVSE